MERVLKMAKNKQIKTKRKSDRFLIYVDLRDKSDQILFEDYRNKHGMQKTAAATSIVLQALREGTAAQ